MSFASSFTGSFTSSFLGEGGGDLVLRPARASDADRYLQDDLGQLDDSGGSAWVYEDLLVDDLGPDGAPIETGDAVGTPGLWDAVLGEVVGSIVGLPATQRLSGIDAADASNGITGIDLSDCEALLIEFTHTSGGNWDALHTDVLSDGWDFTFWTNNGGRARFTVCVGGVRSYMYFGPPGIIPNGSRYAALWSRTAPGTYDFALYSPAGTLLHSSTVSGPDTGPGAALFMGTTTRSYIDNAVWRERGWSTPITAAQASDVLAGVTTSGWSRDLQGLVTGARDPEDDERLIWEGGTGDQVAATEVEA